MHIVHIFNALTFSGAELLLHSAAPEFHDGNKHTIITTGETPGIFATQLHSKGYRIIHIPFRKNASYFSKYYKTLKELSPDVLHIHAERAFSSHAFLARGLGIPTVRSLHNEFLFEGRLRIVRGIERRLLSRLGVNFLSCSERVKENERIRFGIDSEVIENWYDPNRIPLRTRESEAISRMEFGIPADSFVVTSIGNYGPAKNHEAIIAAVANIGNEFPVYYLHCGAGGEQLQAKLAPDLRTRIKFLGARSDITGVLLAADLFVSASFFEGGPIALLEGAAAGLNVAITETGLGVAFSGQPGARIIQPTPASVEEAIIHFIDVPADQRCELGRQLASYTASRFSPDLGTRRLLAAYRKLNKKA